MPHRRYLSIEPLDPRQLLSSTLSGGVLSVTGTDAADDIRLDVDPVYINLLRIRINGVAEHFLLGDYTSISVGGGAGNDRIEIGDLSVGQPKSLTVDAGAGDDDVIGSPYADRLAGGDGNDSIHGNGGNDTLHGEAGDDDLSDDGGTRNDLKGDAGNDTIRFLRNGTRETSLGTGNGGDGNDTLIAQIGTRRKGTTKGRSASLYGGSGDDVLEGLRLRGEDGDDRLTILDSADANVHGDDGNDTIDGGTSEGGRLFGDAGADRINVVRVAAIHGGSGDDQLTITGAAGTSHVQINGDAGDDAIQGGPGADRLEGDAGDDTLHGGSGNDTIAGRDGRDVLYGDNGIDWLSGGDGNDRLFGGRDSDVVDGGAGDDRLYGGRDETTHQNPQDGNDSAIGGAGRDWIDPKHPWYSIDADADDEPTGASGGNTGAGGGYYGSYSSSYISGGINLGDLSDLAANYAATGLPWHMIYANAAAFVGVSTGAPTAQQLAAVTIPSLTKAERTNVKPSILHLPSDWTLTPLSNTDAGLRWYSVSSPAPQMHPVVRGESTIYTRSYYYNYGLSNRYAYNDPSSAAQAVTSNTVTMLAINAKTLVLLDSAAQAPDTAKWVPTTGWNRTALVTRASTVGAIPGLASPLRFGRPTDPLPAVPAGKRAIFTLDGVILIDDTGGQLSA